jgi:uncharacterized protein YecT (DUF1311 family)
MKSLNWASVVRYLVAVMIILPWGSAMAESSACRAARENAEDWAVRKCAVEAHSSLEDQLTVAWQRLTSDAKKLDAQSGSTELSDVLLTDERNWIKYKETVCKYYWNANFGENGSVFNGPACQEGVLKARIEYLKQADQDLLSVQ